MLGFLSDSQASCYIHVFIFLLFLETEIRQRWTSFCTRRDHCTTNHWWTVNFVIHMMTEKFNHFVTIYTWTATQASHSKHNYTSMITQQNSHSTSALVSCWNTSLWWKKHSVMWWCKMVCKRSVDVNDMSVSCLLNGRQADHWAAGTQTSDNNDRTVVNRGSGGTLFHVCAAPMGCLDVQWQKINFDAKYSASHLADTDRLNISTIKNSTNQKAVLRTARCCCNFQYIRQQQTVADGR